MSTENEQTWGSRKWRAIKKQQARMNANNRATPHLDAARAELATGPKLVVESLEEKLERHLPGAFVEAAPSGLGFAPPPPDERWQVRQLGEFAMRTLAVGPTPREAIARAIFLFGGER